MGGKTYMMIPFDFTHPTLTAMPSPWGFPTPVTVSLRAF